MVFGGRADTGIRQRKVKRGLLEFCDGLGRHEADDQLELLIEQSDGLLDGRSILGEQAPIDTQRPTSNFSDLPVAASHLHGSLTQGLTDEEVSLGVTELVMTMTRVRRILRLAHEITGRDEDDVILEFRALRDGGLRVAQGCPFLRGVDPWARQLADDDREFRHAKLLTHIVDQMDEVLFILRHGGLGIHTVVPALIPDEAGQLDRGTVVSRKIFLQIRQCFADFGDHLKIIRADLAASARRTEITVQALASPCRLDE